MGEAILKLPLIKIWVSISLIISSLSIVIYPIGLIPVMMAYANVRNNSFGILYLLYPILPIGSIILTLYYLKKKINTALLASFIGPIPAIILVVFLLIFK